MSVLFALAVSLAAVVPLAPQQVPAALPVAPVPDRLVIQKMFHIVGIPGVKRNGRGDLALTDQELIFQQGKKQPFILPYSRIRRVQLLRGERHYGKSTYAAALATPFGVGALLILKKRKVDVLVMDFVNERGGLMGTVLQVPEKQGASCKDWFTRFGVVVEEPPPETPRSPG